MDSSNFNFNFNFDFNLELSVDSDSHRDDSYGHAYVDPQSLRLPSVLDRAGPANPSLAPWAEPPNINTAALGPAAVGQSIDPALLTRPASLPLPVPATVAGPVLVPTAAPIAAPAAGPIATTGAPTAPQAATPSARSKDPFHPHASGRRSLWLEEAQQFGQQPRWGCVHCGGEPHYTRPLTLERHHERHHPDHPYDPFGSPHHDNSAQNWAGLLATRSAWGTGSRTCRPTVTGITYRSPVCGVQGLSTSSSYSVQDCRRGASGLLILPLPSTDVDQSTEAHYHSDKRAAHHSSFRQITSTTLANMSLSQPPNPSLPTTASPAPSTTLPDSNQIPPAESSTASMNNTAAARNGGRAKRNKRDSQKKREAKGSVDTPNQPKEKKPTTSSTGSAIPSSELTMLMPIYLADPRPTDVLHPRPRQMNLAYGKSSDVLGQSWQFYEIADKLSNKNGFRYTYAASDPGFPHIKYRQTDVPPYYSRFSFEDSPPAITFTEDGLAVTTTDPWHSARANICAREGTYYYEARVISGVVKGSQQPGVSPRGNIRLGFARREADLDVNVGVDCYGYGIRDVNGEVVNRMRCEYFFPKDEAIYEGDVIGMLITLPPLSLHKKIVEGTYDPTIDGDGTNPPSTTHTTPAPDTTASTPTHVSATPSTHNHQPIAMNLIRDRIPFHLKSDFLYQQSHIFPSKHLRDYAFNLKETPTYGPPSPTNTEDPSLRTLPGSSITIYKNGVKMGTPFRNLYAFLPPASRATQGSNNLGIGERENADDGMIGYFPMVSCHCGGAVECRFEAPWFIGPPTDDVPDGNIKPFGERFNEQIVEDVLADIVDEIEAAFAGWGVEVGTQQGNVAATAMGGSLPPSVAASGGAAGVLVDDGASISVGTPQMGSVAGETAVSEDVEMGM
ncbi:hypothetical protein FQN52_006695 [Onygenales sp. PD_12]|nr:hypothetical protein FQN52_006695 [Onygenales sp. PD_12]